MTLRLDHLAVSAASLGEGVARVEAALGVTMAAGGQHPLMGTHNRLLSLGDLYLEVIAVDPAAPALAHPRWFDLDRFAGPPRLTTWVAGCDDLDAELAASPEGAGVPVALSRGEYRWQMAVPRDGRLPFDGAFPALIAWQGSAHPAQALPDRGLRLITLDVVHPAADALRDALAGRLSDPRVTFATGPLRLRATIATPSGLQVLE